MGLTNFLEKLEGKAGSSEPKPIGVQVKPADYTTTYQTKALLFQSSKSTTTTFIKDPATQADVYVITRGILGEFSGLNPLGLERELREGSKEGKILGGYKRNALTGDLKICIGNPKDGTEKYFKVKGLSDFDLSTKPKFTAPNGRNYQWVKPPSKEDFAWDLVDRESGEHVAWFRPHQNEMSWTKMGRLEFVISTLEWEITMITSILAAFNKKTDDVIASEVAQAFIGI